MINVEMKKIYDELLELRDDLKEHIEYYTFLHDNNHRNHSYDLPYDSGRIDEAENNIKRLNTIINSIKKNSALKGCKVTPNKKPIRKTAHRTKRG